MMTSRPVRSLAARLTLALCAIPCAAAEEAPDGSGAPRTVLLLRPEWLLDVETGERRTGWAVRVDGDRITAIRKRRAIDCSGP
jgi:hypothetical protein